MPGAGNHLVRVAGSAKKLKRRLKPEGLETWALAGIWESTVATDCQKSAAVVLLTTAAHPSIAQVHDRMPCIIPVVQAAAWLTGSSAQEDLLRPLAAAFT